MTVYKIHQYGYLNSLDWSEWTGVLEWTTGLEYWSVVVFDLELTTTESHTKSWHGI